MTVTEKDDYYFDEMKEDLEIKINEKEKNNLKYFLDSKINYSEEKQKKSIKIKNKI